MLSALCCLTLMHQQNRPKVVTDRPTLLAIYKERDTKFDTTNGASTGSSGGVTYDRVGLCNWSVLDGGYHGVPCKIYNGDGKWVYQRSIHNTAITDFREANYTMTYYVGLDGVPIHSESHFTDSGDQSFKSVDVVGEYQTDHIDVTVTTNGQVQKSEIYPKFGMEEFAGMFEPLIRSGLLQDQERDCAVLHPYTGVPYEFKIKFRARFTGSYFFLPQAGYCFDVLGSEGSGMIYVTREGQLLEEEFDNKISASLEEGPTAEETQGWGHFDLHDWDESTAESNPDRPTYHTLAVPVLFKDPNILFPVPCAISD